MVLVLTVLGMGYLSAQTSTTPGSGGPSNPIHVTTTSTSGPVSTSTVFPDPIPGEGIQPGYPANVSPTKVATQVTP